MIYWTEKWDDPQHIKSKVEIFKLLTDYLVTPPKNILDIGCGYARESEYFQKEYGTDLWLLDGDFNSTKDKHRQVKYGTAETFAFYNKVETLLESYNSRGMKYTFVDATNINIPANVKFDLIYSGLSCGFHYPANTYKDLVLKHSHKNTKVVFDLRNVQEQEDFEIVNVIRKDRKSVKAEIKFV